MYHALVDHLTVHHRVRLVIDRRWTVLGSIGDLVSVFGILVFGICARFCYVCI